MRQKDNILVKFLYKQQFFEFTGIFGTPFWLLINIGVLLAVPIRTIVTTHDDLSLLFSVLLFQLIPLCLYYLAHRYFRSGKFQPFLEDIKNSRGEYRFLERQKLITILICSITTIMTVINTIIIFATQSDWIDSIKEDYDPDILWVLYGLIIIHSAVVWNIVAITMVTFCMVFSKHIHDLKVFKKRFEERLWSLDQVTVNDITRDIIEIRFIINESIGQLEAFYTTTTIL